MDKITEAIQHTHPVIKHSADVGAAGIAWGALFTEYVPNIAAVLSITWLGMQIYSWVINKRWRRVESDE